RCARCLSEWRRKGFCARLEGQNGHLKRTKALCPFRISAERHTTKRTANGQKRTAEFLISPNGLHETDKFGQCGQREQPKNRTTGSPIYRLSVCPNGRVGAVLSLDDKLSNGTGQAEKRRHYGRRVIRRQSQATSQPMQMGMVH